MQKLTSRAAMGIGSRLLLAPFFVMLVVSSAQSQTITPTPTGTPTITPRAYDFSVVGNELSYKQESLITGDRLKVTTRADRSYECRIFNPHRQSGAYLTGIEDSNSQEPVSWVYCGSIEPVVTVPDSHPEPNKTRICFTTSLGGDYFLTIDTANINEQTYFRCQETTLYGGYNTSVADFNFLEVKNITGSNLDVRVTAVNFDGTVVIDNQEYTILANQRFDVNVHVAAGTGVYGLIRINYDGPIGAIVAELAEYVLTSVTPFTFEKVGSSRLVPREK